MTKLGARNYAMLSEAVKSCGTYNPAECFAYLENQLYLRKMRPHLRTLMAFMHWVYQSVETRAFGQDNYEQRFKEFISSDAPKSMNGSDIIDDWEYNKQI